MEVKESSGATEKTEVDSISDCPQSEEKLESNEWTQSNGEYTQEEERRNDEGYEGDMEGDGDLMPPPSSAP